MEGIEVKTEPAEDIFTSEMDIEEHSIKMETDQLDCFIPEEMQSLNHHSDNFAIEIDFQQDSSGFPTYNYSTTHTFQQVYEQAFKKFNTGFKVKFDEQTPSEIAKITNILHSTKTHGVVQSAKFVDNHVLEYVSEMEQIETTFFKPPTIEECSHLQHLSTLSDKQCLESNFNFLKDGGKATYHANTQTHRATEAMSSYGDFDMSIMPCLLQIAAYTSYETVPGIHTPSLFYGSVHTVFSCRVEDMDLATTNYLVHGSADKLWVLVPRSQYAKLNGLMRSLNKVHEDEMKRHKPYIFSTQFLDNNNIEYMTVRQKQNEMMVVFPRTFHQGTNLGYNVAVSKNYASSSWLAYGLTCGQCGNDAAGKHGYMVDLRGPVLACMGEDALHKYMKSELYVAVDGRTLRCNPPHISRPLRQFEIQGVYSLYGIINNPFTEKYLRYHKADAEPKIISRRRNGLVNYLKLDERSLLILGVPCQSAILSACCRGKGENLNQRLRHMLTTKLRYRNIKKCRKITPAYQIVSEYRENHPEEDLEGDLD